MENQEELLDSIIEDIAALLANGYLRLRRARARSELAATPGFQATGGRLDSVGGHSPYAAMNLPPKEKGDRS
jgi:hypothetical protein